MTKGSQKRIIVLKGGPSGERPVSLVTGKACAEALRDAGYLVEEFDLGHDLIPFIRCLGTRPDAVFNALHGTFGEDGGVQAIMDLMSIPYTHSGKLASALAMDKVVAKQFFTHAGIRCPAGVIVDRKTIPDSEPMARPYVIKPVSGGSSLGVTIFHEGDNRHPRDPGLLPDIGALIAEPFIAGRDLTVAVMDDRALAVTELRPKSGFYDYEAKYTGGKTDHVLPAPIPAQVESLAMQWAVAAHKVLGCRGVTRADFRLDDRQGEKGLYLLEINTQPGMTPLSLVPEQAAYCGISFQALCSWIVERAQCDT